MENINLTDKFNFKRKNTRRSRNYYTFKYRKESRRPNYESEKSYEVRQVEINQKKEFISLRKEMKKFLNQMSNQMNKLKEEMNELKEEMNKLKSELKEEFSSEMRKMKEEFSSEMRKMKEEFSSEMRKMKEEFSSEMKEMKKLILSKCEENKNDIDWIFEISTRPIIEKSRGQIFTRCSDIKSFKEFENYFNLICDEVLQTELEESNFNLEKTLREVHKYYCGLGQESSKDSTAILFELYSYFKFGQNTKRLSKEFKINLSGGIRKVSNWNILISVGEVKATLSRGSRKKAISKCHPVLMLLYNLLFEVYPDNYFYPNAYIYYGRKGGEDTKPFFDEENMITYNFVQVQW